VDFWWLELAAIPQPPAAFHDLTNLEWFEPLLLPTNRSRQQAAALAFRPLGRLGQPALPPIQFSGDALGPPSACWRLKSPLHRPPANVGCLLLESRYRRSQSRAANEGVLRPAGASSAHSTRGPFESHLDQRCQHGSPGRGSYPQWAQDSMKVKPSNCGRSFFFSVSLQPRWKQACDKLSFRSWRPMYIDNPTVEEAYHQPQEYQFGD